MSFAKEKPVSHWEILLYHNKSIFISTILRRIDQKNANNRSRGSQPLVSVDYSSSKKNKT